ncbi:TetR/AcrR family transcriptional regulator [Streptomyces sp. NBC_01433]|uniref:TetR/AcrR family transcriptional regulator n=1 Tax=Streptomyces sp. NBC_01433 TaxID=2903864 RepID=UPI0022565907|nr:TetR/AcrR family transcriptional regulator [Streptomyces sp. NBC_01433]MCX4675762.1 TetR/AcrR family transcriptional regulator [Streptomyces sp. NBC_01433]
MTTPMGRRERKKAATRQALADAALRLFIEHGYDAVTLHDIAEAADVSTTTLLKHFPSKEALVFDEEAEQEAGLVTAVHDRTPGTTIPQALCAHVKRVRVRAAGSDSAPDVGYTDFRNLVTNTPALSDYAHRMWMRHQDALAHAIAHDTGAPPDDPRSAALARFALETSALAHEAADPAQAVDVAFDLLERGWDTPAQHGTGQN